MLRDRILKFGSATTASAADVAAARLLFRFSYFDDASRLAVAALNGGNSNSEAWEILVESEHMAGRDRNALTMISRMPRSVDANAMGNPGFLLALASIYQSEGQLSNASTMLEKAKKLSGSDSDSLMRIEMQKASLASAQGDTQLAYQIYHEISEKFPDQLDASIGMINALHAAKRDTSALAIMSQLPEGVSTRLAHDSEYLQAAGFVYNATGHTGEALRCLRAVTEHYRQQHQAIPFGAGIALAWLQLETGDESQLADTLDHLGKRHGLSMAQTIAMQRVWSEWSVRRARAAYDSGDTKRALKILQTASQAYPGDGGLRFELAGMYVRTGQANQGMRMFRSMEWTHATVDQFNAGISAAITANSLSDAQYWFLLGMEEISWRQVNLENGCPL